MQMIDLSDIKDFHAARFMIYWLVATVIAGIVAYSLDSVAYTELTLATQRIASDLVVRGA